MTGFEFFGIAMLVAGMADSASTELALSRGAVEANPLMRSASVRCTVKPALTVGIFYATRKLHKKKPKTALFLRVAITTGWAYVATRNFQIAYSLRF